MENIDAQPAKNDETPSNDSKKKKIYIIIAAILGVVIAAALFVCLYKIPYDKAAAEFNAALEQFNAEVSALEERNLELSQSIEALNQVINAEDIPVDELLLSEAQAILAEAREVPLDSAPAAPKLSMGIDETVVATSEILELTGEVRAMGDYGDTLAKVKAAESEYRSMVDNFKGAVAEVVWVGVDKELPLLRFVAKLSNPNDYTLSRVTTEWTAYDVDGAVVGSLDGTQPDIPANGFVYYVGGAGGALLSGTPANVELKVSSEGILTNRVSPQISVSNVNMKDNGYSWYTVSADCVTDTAVNTANLDGQSIVKGADGQIIDADFWLASNLPETLDAGGKFKASLEYLDLPALPGAAEVYMYYKWE